MKQHKKFTIFFILFLFLSFQKAWSKKYVINKDHSEISFEIDYLLVSRVRGRFLKFQGQLDYDREKNKLENIIVQVEASSIFTANKMRDSHLKKKDFLFSSNYPNLVFKSLDTQWIKKNDFLIKGEVTIRGVKREIQLPISFTPSIKDAWNKESFFAPFSFVLNRKDFNMLWNKSLDKGQILLGNDVKIKGVFQIQPEGKKTESSTHMIPDTKILRIRQKIQKGEKLTIKEKKDISHYKEVMNKAPIKLPLTEIQKPKASKPVISSSAKGMISIIILGFFGFIGSAVTAFYLKKFTMNTLFSGQYDNSIFFSTLCDILATFVVIAFAASFYNIMVFVF